MSEEMIYNTQYYKLNYSSQLTASHSTKY